MNEIKQYEKMFFDTIKENTLKTIQQQRNELKELNTIKNRKTKTFKDVQRMEQLKTISERAFFVNKRI